MFDNHEVSIAASALSMITNMGRVVNFSENNNVWKSLKEVLFFNFASEASKFFFKNCVKSATLASFGAKIQILNVFFGVKIQMRHFWCLFKYRKKSTFEKSELNVFLLKIIWKNEHPTCHNQKVRWEQKWGWHSQTILRIDILMNDLMTLYPTEGLDQIQFWMVFPSTFLIMFLDDLLSHKFSP